MREDTSAPESQADVLPFEINASSNERFALHFNAKAAAAFRHLLELQSSGELAALPSYCITILILMLSQIDDEQLPRLIARCSQGWLAEQMNRSPGHIRRGLDTLKYVGLLACTERGGGHSVNSYELLPCSAPARRVPRASAQARRRAISALARGYGAPARRVSLRASAQNAGDTLLENVVVVDTSNSNISARAEEASTTGGVADVVVGLLLGIGMEEPRARDVAALPHVTVALVRKVIEKVQKRARDRKDVDNPPGLVDFYLRNKKAQTDSTRRQHERGIAHLPEHVQELATADAQICAARATAEEQDLELVRSLSSDEIERWRKVILLGGGCKAWESAVWEKADPLQLPALCAEIARRARKAREVR